MSDEQSAEARALFEEEVAGLQLGDFTEACFRWYLKGYTARGKDAQAVVKPCCLPCPKCGSQDVLRRFHAQDSRLEMNDVAGSAPDEYAARRDWYWVARQDHLVHLCRVCQYSWASKPLAKEG